MKLFENTENASLEDKYQRLKEYFVILQEATVTVSRIWDECKE